MYVCYSVCMCVCLQCVFVVQYWLCSSVHAAHESPQVIKLTNDTTLDYWIGEFDCSAELFRWGPGFYELVYSWCIAGSLN